MMFRNLAASLALFGLIAGPSSAVWAQDRSSPVLVELFTSQGCSSCPPADAVLGELAKRPDVVALGFHVNYWDRLGWRDPFASKEATARQYAYSRSLGGSNVYTPQMVVGGAAGLVGSRRGEVLAAVQGDRSSPAPIQIGITPDSSGGLTVEIPATGGGTGIWYARYDLAHRTQVERGENADRQLADFNVVTEFAPLARPAAGPLRVAAPPPGSGLAIWVQRDGPGAVIAAVKFETPS